MGINSRELGVVRVALYARVSTRDKDQDPEVHLAPMREYVSVRGWSASAYVDAASAADMAGRSAWARLMADARRRRIDLVLVWKLDRAFRSTLHCLRTLEAWQQQGVGFACLTQNVDTTSPEGQLLLTILAAVAEFERSLVSERQGDGQGFRNRRVVVGLLRACSACQPRPQLAPRQVGAQHVGARQPMGGQSEHLSAGRWPSLP